MMGKGAREEQSPARLEKWLLAAYRNHHRRVTWRRTLEWASLGAAAAVLLIFLWTVSGRSKVQTSPAPRKDVSSQSRMPLDAQTTIPPKQQDEAAAGESPVPVEASAVEAYAASDFVPVPFTGAITPDDPGMIVRVQLTRASLAQLGYPVAETPDEDLILADVLVGEDGWPRGVKLIQ
jgi:hypothetical protein